MKQTELFESIKKRAFENVYFFCGPEEYVKNAALSALRSAILPEGMEMLNEATLTNPSVDELIAAMETFPFMAERRLVIVRELRALQQGGEEDAASGDAKQVLEILQNAPETACTVIWHSGKLDERKSLAKKLLQMPGAVKFEYLTGKELSAWTQKEAGRRGKKIAPEAMEEFLFNAGPDLQSILGSLEQLCAYVLEREVIALEDVGEVVRPSLEATVFVMIDAIMADNMPKAQKMVKTLLDAGEARYGILAMLIRQLRLMADLRVMAEAGRSADAICSALKLQNYVYKKTAASAGKMNSERLLEAYRKCVETDYMLKSGQLREQAALDRAMFLLHGLFQRKTAARKR